MDKGVKTIQWRRDSLFNSVMGQSDIQGQKKNLNLHPETYTKIISKWIIDLNVNVKS